MKNDPRRSRSLKQLGSKLPGGGAFLLTGESDIKYFSGFYSHGELLLVTRNNRPICFIDSMNRSLAEKELKSSLVKVVSGKGRVIDTAAGAIRDMKLKEIYLDTGVISKMAYDRLLGRLKGLKLKAVIEGRPVREVLGRMRAIKDKAEISLLRFLAKETVRIWRGVSREIRPGMTEVDIARMVDISIRKEGYENSFPTIAASGVNSAYPHAIPGKKKLGKNEHLVVDFGIRHNSYCSDLTRIWGECKMNGQIKDICAKVREAQKVAISCIGPGVSIRRTAEKINGIFAESGYGKMVMHGLGHGVGLDVHESPTVGVFSGERFEEGMVVTVEPGLYVPGKGGARVEDMVLVTSKGREVLTK